MGVCSGQNSCSHMSKHGPILLFVYRDFEKERDGQRERDMHELIVKNGSALVTVKRGHFVFKVLELLLENLKNLQNKL